jgi:hypothetical protein
MATTPKTKPATTVIDENHKSFVGDPDYASALAKLDHAKLRTATTGLHEKIATFLNYYVLYRNMKSMKITRGTLSQDAQNTLVSRGKDAVNTFQAISTSISGIGDATASCGFDKVVDRHIESLCQHLNYNPKVLAYLHQLKDTGVTDAEISCVSEDLKKHNYNILRYGGADGTVSGFVKFTASLAPRLAKEHALIEKNGMPTVEAAGGSTSGTTAGVAAGAAVLAGILCLVTVFYA